MMPHTGAAPGLGRLNDQLGAAARAYQKRIAAQVDDRRGGDRGERGPRKPRRDDQGTA